MSRLVTQLVADEPAVVLVGENTILRDKLAIALSYKGIAVDFVLPSAVLSNTQKIEEAYKVLWICDGPLDSNEYLELLQNLAQVKKQIVILMPIFLGISACQSDVLTSWVEETKKQTQRIVDCNYYLPSANFIFGHDIIGNTQNITIFNYILNTYKRNLVVDIFSDLYFISVDDYVSQVIELIFIPKSQVSTLIKGKPTNSTSFLGLVKKLYDSYHNSNLEILSDKVTVINAIPFSVSQRQVFVDTRVIATHLVKHMRSPEPEEEFSADIPSPKPNSETNQHQESQREIIRGNIPPSPLPLQLEYQPAEEFDPEQQFSPVPPEDSGSLEVEKATTTQKASSQQDADLNSEIQRIFKDTRTEKKVERVEKIVKSTKKIAKKSKRKTKLFYGGLLSIGMAVGMILLACIYFISGSILQKQVVGFLTKTSETQDLTQAPASGLLKTTSFVAAQTNIYGKIIELNLIVRNSVLVDLIQQFTNIPTVLARADSASKNLVLNILSGNIGDTTKLTENLTQSVSEAYERLSLIQATLEQIDLGENSAQQQAVVDQISKKVQEIRSGLEIHQQLQQVLPDMVGVSGKRTYALLLQNNQELRPTGGFIQVVALLNFDNGSLISHQVYSIYELDKKLPGAVVPPDDITTYLGETNWFFRDSNWDPDFKKTSEQISWFIEKSLGVQVDGVIAMNVFSLEDLIQATGPIDLPEYNEVINNRNIEERMEFHSEVVLIDSPDSIDYSVKILTKILEKLTALKEDSVPTLLEGLRHSLDTKQTLIYSKIESEQSIMQSLGWTGSLMPPACPSRLSITDCTVDTVAQVEANIGINKANYYLDRTISHKINISKTSAQHTRSIHFNNKAQSNSWPKGTYKTFIRFYVNPNVVVQKATINGLELAQNQIVQSEESGFKVIGIRVDVPIEKQITLDLVYSTPLDSAGPFSYVFYNRKQSGLDADPFTVEITHAPDIKPVLIAPAATISGNTITFSALTLDEASLYGVQFE